MLPGQPWVLVVEDDPFLVRLIVWALRGDGYDVVVARDGREATDAIASTLLFDEGGRPPDLIITDVRLPGISGLSLLAGIRAHGWKMPIIVMTAHDIERVRPEAERLGATAVFHKPFDVDDLRTAVMHLFAKKRSGTYATRPLPVEPLAANRARR